MSNIQIFTKDNFSVRTIRDEDGKIWFVARDVAEALEYNLDGGMGRIFGHIPEQWADGKRIATSSVNGVEQMREMLCLSEEGLYFFLGRSDKPKALPYQMWIARDVVPSIVQTGDYSINKEQAILPSGVLDGAQKIFELAGIKDNQLVLAMDNVYKSYTGRSALQVGCIELVAPNKKQILSPREIGRHFNISGQRVNEILAGGGYQHKINGMWEPLKDGEGYAVMLDTGKQHSNGTPVRQLKWNTGILNVVKNLLAASA